MTLDSLIKTLKTTPENICFGDVITVINENYNYSPTAFTNGEIHNAAGTNEGSCRIFAFAKLHQLTGEQTLHCFGDYYRKDVLERPEGEDHANIRNFMITGWTGIRFEQGALKVM